MAALAVPALIASTAISAVGTIASGQAAARQGEALQQQYIQQGQAQQQAAEFEAAQFDIQAKNEFASGQRDMLEKRRNKKLALSTLQARSASSGFSATDPTTLALGDEISRYGTYQEQFSLYGGENAAVGSRLAAAGRRFSGEQALRSSYASGEAAAEAGRAARTSSYFNAAGTILGGISGMAGKYGGTSSGFTPYTNSSGALVLNRYANRYG